MTQVSCALFTSGECFSYACKSILLGTSYSLQVASVNEEIRPEFLAPLRPSSVASASNFLPSSDYSSEGAKKLRDKKCIRADQHFTMGQQNPFSVGKRRDVKPSKTSGNQASTTLCNFRSAFAFFPYAYGRGGSFFFPLDGSDFLRARAEDSVTGEGRLLKMMERSFSSSMPVPTQGATKSTGVNNILTTVLLQFSTTTWSQPRICNSTAKPCSVAIASRTG